MGLPEFGKGAIVARGPLSTPHGSASTAVYIPTKGMGVDSSVNEVAAIRNWVFCCGCMGLFKNAFYYI
jgi:hypothetical protein